MGSSSHFFDIVATGRPLLKDLHNYITPNFAAQWRMIGTLLDLPSGTLDIIKYDNHDKARPCCDAMLEEWLEVDPSASWEKLLKVIKSLPVSSEHKGESKGDLGVRPKVLCPLTFIMYIV